MTTKKATSSRCKTKREKKLPEALISTDGSARPGSPNGTWGAVIRIKGPNGKIVSTKELSGVRWGDYARPMLGGSMELTPPCRLLPV